MAEEFRYVRIVGPVQLGPKFAFKHSMFVEHFVTKAKVFTSSMAGIHIGLRLVDAFLAAEAEDGNGVAKLTKDGWVMLKDLVDEPKDCGYPTLRGGTNGDETIPLPLRVTVEMGDAILDATSKEPAPPESESEPQPEPAPAAETEEAAQ